MGEQLQQSVHVFLYGQYSFVEAFTEKDMNVNKAVLTNRERHERLNKAVEAFMSTQWVSTAQQRRSCLSV